MAEHKPLKLIEGAVGAGLVLVVLPSLGLYFGLDKISANPNCRAWWRGWRASPAATDRSERR